jgi:hypothetical protein
MMSPRIADEAPARTTKISGRATLHCPDCNHEWIRRGTAVVGLAMRVWTPPDDFSHFCPHCWARGHVESFEGESWCQVDHRRRTHELTGRNSTR